MTETTTVRNDPWSGQQPYLQDLFGQAQNLYNQGYGSQYFPGSTVVPFSPDTQNGMDMIRRMSMQTPIGLPQGYNVANQAMTGGQTNRLDVLNRAASGGMQNPFLAAMMQAAGMGGGSMGAPGGQPGYPSMGGGAGPSPGGQPGGARSWSSIGARSAGGTPSMSTGVPMGWGSMPGMPGGDMPTGGAGQFESMGGAGGASPMGSFGFGGFGGYGGQPGGDPTKSGGGESGIWNEGNTGGGSLSMNDPWASMATGGGQPPVYGGQPGGAGSNIVSPPGEAWGGMPSFGSPGGPGGMPSPFNFGMPSGGAGGTPGGMPSMYAPNASGLGELTGVGGSGPNPFLQTILKAGSMPAANVGSVGHTTMGIDQLNQSTAGNNNIDNLRRVSGQQITAGGDALNATASGSMLTGNPYLDSMYDIAARKVKDNTNSAFAAAGRYGSGAHTDVLARDLGDLATNMYGAQYDSERNRQMQAATELGNRQAQSIANQMQGETSIAGLDESRLGRLASAGTSLAGIQSADLNRDMQGNIANAQMQDSALGRQLQAALGVGQLGENSLNRQANMFGQLVTSGDNALARQLGAASDINNYGLNQTGQGLTAANLLPMLQQLQYSGAGNLMNIGNMQEGQAGRQLQDAMQRWQFAQQNPWDQLGRYAGVINGAGNVGGTQTTTAPGGSSNPLLNLLGGGAAGAGIAGALGATGPVGWGVAGLGALIGAFAH